MRNLRQMLGQKEPFYTIRHRLFKYIETKAKCHILKSLTGKGTLRYAGLHAGVS
jgi:hypothetical protein